MDHPDKGEQQQEEEQEQVEEDQPPEQDIPATTLPEITTNKSLERALTDVNIIVFYNYAITWRLHTVLY